MVIALPYRAPGKLLNFTLQKGDGFSRIHDVCSALNIRVGQIGSCQGTTKVYATFLEKT